MRDISVYAESYGCASNKYDYEVLLGQLSKAGYRIETDAAKADVILLNTCAVKKATEDRILRRLCDFANRGKPLIIAGCLPKVDPRRVAEAAPSYSAVVDPFTIDRINEVISKALQGERRQIYFSESPVDSTLLPQSRSNRFISITKISEGCLGSCSYCCAKLARGRLFSFPQERILDKIKRSLREGAREIYLTSQDAGCYGRDVGINLIDLLQSIGKLRGDFKVRVGMMTPNYALEMIDDLLEIYKNRRFFKFVHVPVQTGSDTVLADMNREYSAGDFVFLAQRIRKRFPRFTVATDIIVGFPTETDQDFAETVKLVEETGPDVVNISRYGHRPRTASSSLPSLPADIVNQRSKTLSLLCSKISFDSNSRMIGRRFSSYVTEKSERGTFLARAPNYKRVLVEHRANLLGKSAGIRVTGCADRYLTGEVTQEY